MSEPRGLADIEQLRFIIAQVVDIVDSRRERETVQRDEKLTEALARIAVLEGAERAAGEVRIARDREIKDIKTTIGGMDTKLDRLVADKAAKDAAIGVGKWLVGTGFLGVVGSVIVATLHYIGWLRPPT